MWITEKITRFIKYYINAEDTELFHNLLPAIEAYSIEVLRNSLDYNAPNTELGYYLSDATLMNVYINTVTYAFKKLVNKEGGHAYLPIKEIKTSSTLKAALYVRSLVVDREDCMDEGLLPFVAWGMQNYDDRYGEQSLFMSFIGGFAPNKSSYSDNEFTFHINHAVLTEGHIFSSLLENDQVNIVGEI